VTSAELAEGKPVHPRYALILKGIYGNRALQIGYNLPIQTLASRACFLTFNLLNLSVMACGRRWRRA
jgi:hypothetical protein